MKKTRMVEEYICDICEINISYVKCKICNRDVCPACNYSLYSRYYTSNYVFLIAMCGSCFDTFIELTKKEVENKNDEK